MGLLITTLFGSVLGGYTLWVDGSQILKFEAYIAVEGPYIFRSHLSRVFFSPFGFRQ